MPKQKEYLIVAPAEAEYLNGKRKEQRIHKTRLLELRENLPHLLPTLFWEIRKVAEMKNDTLKEEIHDALSKSMEGEDFQEAFSGIDNSNVEKVATNIIGSLDPNDVEPVLDSIRKKFHETNTFMAQFWKFNRDTRGLGKRIAKELPPDMRQAIHHLRITDMLFQNLEAREISDDELSRTVKSYLESDICRRDREKYHKMDSYRKWTKNSPNVRRICTNMVYGKRTPKDIELLEKKPKVLRFLLKEKLIEKIGDNYLVTDRGKEVFSSVR